MPCDCHPHEHEPAEAEAEAVEPEPVEPEAEEIEEEEEEPRCDSCDRLMDGHDCERCSGCARCCEHIDCPSCERRMHTDEMCWCCDECSRCCNCWYCEACQESHAENTDRCSECENCESECSCPQASDEDPDGEGDMPYGRGLPEWVSPPEKPVFHRGRGYKTNPSRRFISVEIEVARSNESSYRVLNPLVRAWDGTAVVRDGSLPSGGYEINTAPTSGDLFVEEINTLCAGLREVEASVTTECGLHVHVDARNMTHRRLQRLVALYARVEDALFDMVPRSRKSNSYCRRCGPEYLRMGIAAALANVRKSPKRSEEALARAVYDEDITDSYGKQRFEVRKTQKYDSARYAALNLHSWFYRGTVELRLAAGTTDATKITNWAILVASLLDWAATHRDEDIQTLPSDPLAALLEVAPTDTVREWVKARHAKFCNV